MENSCPQNLSVYYCTFRNLHGPVPNVVKCRLHSRETYHWAI